MTHQQIPLNLLESIQDHADGDQQRGAAIEGSELVVDSEEHSAGRHNGDEAKENRAGPGYTGHNFIDVLSRLLAGLDSRDEAAVLLHFFSHHSRIDGDGSIEEGEHDDQDEEHDIVPYARIARECSRETTGGIPAGEEHREHHQGLGEDDRHNARSIDLEREVLADTAVLLVADNPLCVLHRNLADSLHESDCSDDDEHPHDHLDDEEQQTATAVGGDLLADFGDEGVRQTGHDTDHDDDGDTVADAAVGDALTEPHYEH